MLLAQIYKLNLLLQLLLLNDITLHLYSCIRDLANLRQHLLLKGV